MCDRRTEPNKLNERQGDRKKYSKRERWRVRGQTSGVIDVTISP